MGNLLHELADFVLPMSSCCDERLCLREKMLPRFLHHWQILFRASIEMPEKGQIRLVLLLLVSKLAQLPSDRFSLLLCQIAIGMSRA